MIIDACEHRKNRRVQVDPDRKGRYSAQPDECPGTRSDRHQYREQLDVVAESEPRDVLHAARPVLGKRLPNTDVLRRDHEHQHMHSTKSARLTYDVGKGDVHPTDIRSEDFDFRKPQRGKEAPSLGRGAGLSHSIPVDGPRTVDRGLLNRVGLSKVHRTTTVVRGMSDEKAFHRNSHLPHTLNASKNTLASRSYPARDSLLERQARSNIDTLRKQPKIPAQQKWVAPTAKNTGITPSELSRFATSARSVPGSSLLMRRASLGPLSGLVPRPSATPDRFSRSARQQRVSQNPLSTTK
jgi:hypothetical protein